MERSKHYKKFAELMYALSIAVDKDPSVKRTEMYYRYLEDLDIKDLSNAVNEIIKTEKIPVFPTIGKIRSMIEIEKDEDLEIKASEAWRKACKLVWDHGESGRPTGNYLLDESVRLAFGGWKAFGDTDPKYDGVDRQRFMKCYTSVIKRDDKKMLQESQIKKKLQKVRKDIKEIEEHKKP